MKLIIDSNILLSALIKDSTTRKIIVTSNWNFFYPEMSFHEIKKYKDLVIKKAGLTEKEYYLLISNIMEFVIFSIYCCAVSKLYLYKNIILQKVSYQSGI